MVYTDHVILKEMASALQCKSEYSTTVIESGPFDDIGHAMLFELSMPIEYSTNT